jgi:hypothetical protein
MTPVTNAVPAADPLAIGFFKIILPIMVFVGVVRVLMVILTPSRKSRKPRKRW